MKTTSGERKVNTLEMEAEEFESELGNVSVAKDRLERQQLEKQKYEELTEDYSSEQFPAVVPFSDIEKLDFEEELRPHIRLKLEKGLKRIIFGEDELEEAENCFDLLNYRWRAYRQNYE